MIKQLINRGFKDQHRKTEFSGLDLFTSADINGVGKSAVLEAVKLALLGEIPGKARSLDDLLQFTSHSEMSVKIVAASGSREVTAERRFLRVAERGEKRPITGDQIALKYEEGDQWIRAAFGAASIGFDPYEFLNLTGQKKRQWIISHSPESRELKREGLYALLFARMVENQFGSGLVREQALILGMQDLNDLFDKAPSGAAVRLSGNLSEIVRRLDAAWVDRIRALLDRFFSLWRESHPVDESNQVILEPDRLTTEENIASMLAGLKAEILRLKNMARERTMTISCLGEADEFVLSGNIEACRGTIRLLVKAVEDLDRRIEKGRQDIREQKRRQERLKFLDDNIAALTRKSGEDYTVSEKSDELSGRLVDTRDLQKELARLNGELSHCSENYHRQERCFLALADELKRKHDKLASRLRLNQPLATAGAGLREESCREMKVFHCPIADEIRCETDMSPYHDLLAREISAVEQKENAARCALEQAKKELHVCGDRVRDLQIRVEDQARSNETIRRQMQSMQQKIMAEEKLRAEVQGQMKAYREEMRDLNNGSMAGPVGFERSGAAESIDVLESKKQGLMMIKKEEAAKLEALLRDQGRAEAVSGLIREKTRAELELKDAQILAGFLGPDGIQGEMAARIADALEKEVNAVLKLIDAKFDFTIDLSGPRFLMGWNRNGKVIPFETINSAHFILFIVPFLAVLLKRMGRIRERDGLPTLKVLCIEAEAMTPKNLVALLKGLSVMKAKGYLDNVLVAHYTSIRDPEKLSGFKEHIFEKGEAS